MNIIEMVEEIIKYLPTFSLLQFSQTSKLNYNIVNRLYVDEELFIKENNIKLINRKYELYCGYIDFNQFVNDIYCYDYTSFTKHRKYYKCKIEECIITIQKHQQNNTRMMISGKKTKDELCQIINNLLKVFNCEGKYKLIHISTNVLYNNLNFSNFQIKSKVIRRNDIHNHINADQIVIKCKTDQIQYLFDRRTNIKFTNFKLFYLTFNHFK